MLKGFATRANAWRITRFSLALSPRLLGGFGIGLVAFIVLSILSIRSATQLVETADWVRHTFEVLAKIQKVNSDMILVQAAVREFVITGQESDLGSYRDALLDQQEDERALRLLTADNPRQQERLSELNGLILQRRLFGRETMDLRRQYGFAAAAALIAGGRGELIMKRIESVVEAMEREEQDLLTQREARSRVTTAKTFYIFFSGATMDLGLLLTILFFLNSEATERHAAEAASRVAAEIVRSTSDAVVTMTLGGIVTSWNPGAELLFGYTAKETVGHTVSMFIPPERALEAKEILTSIGNGDRVEHFETVRLCKDGRRADVSVTASPLRDNTGRIAGAAKILRDISGRKHAEKALQASEQRFRTLANSIPQLAWIARADGHIYWYNEGWYEYTGTTPELMEGVGWLSVHDPKLLPTFMENWKDAISSGQSFEMQFPLRGADGMFRNFLTRVRPFLDAEGHVANWFGTNTDVDGLKQMEESLCVSQARLDSTLSAGSIGTWTWDIVNDLLTADEFTARLFSIDPEAAAKGLPADAYLRAVMGKDQARVSEGLAGAIQTCGAYDIEYRVPQKDGEFRWLQAKGRVEGDEAGNALNFHGAVIDITARKRTEGRFRRLIDSNAQGVIFWNTKGEILSANDAFLLMVGYTREDQEAGLLSWAAMTPPEYAELDRRSMEELAAGGTCTPFEKEYIRKDGSRVPIFLGAATFEDNKDEGVCFVLDISERKRTDQALRESEEHFRFLNDLSEATRTLAEPTQIIAVTARLLGKRLGVSRCTYADVDEDGQQFTVLNDYTDGCESTVGKYQLSLFGARAAASLLRGQTLIIREAKEELLRGDGADLFKATGIHAIIACPLLKDGSLRAMMAVNQISPRQWTPREISLVEDVSGRCWAFIERRIAEESIRVLNAGLEQRVVERTAEAEASNRAKSAFLATMSHEIRTPMNAILGYSQLMLRDAGLGTDAQANLRIINRSGEHLLALIDDVLDMSKIEAGRIELNPETFSLAGMVADVAEMFRLRAETKALRFDVVVDTGSVPYIVADEGKIRQVLINLLGNAVKFTEYGYIRLHVTTDRERVNRAWFLASVEDTGSGISDDEQKKLFQAFTQTSRGINKGTGLGLAISRAYARLMGGTLTVTSSPGAGSTFQFEIPVERGDPKAAIRHRVPRRVVRIRAGQETPRILVADDLPENRDLLQQVLTAVGFSVRCSDNGEEAIREWQEWTPQLILMDVHMPVMDGLEATRRIKEAPGGEDTAIVVLTASVLDEDRRKVRQSGADDFLAKPCREDELLEKVRALLNIVYEYEEMSGAAGETTAPTSPHGVDRLAHVAQLPRKLIEELLHAVSSGDMKLLNRLIDSVDRPEDAEFARDLQTLADGYEYDVLTGLLEEACN